MKLLADDLNQTIDVQIALPENKDALEQAATTVLQRKSRVLDAMATNLSDLRRRFDAQDQMLLQKLNDTNAAFAQISLNKPPNLSLEDYQKQIDDFQREKDKLESEISRRSRGFFEPPKQLTLSEVRNAIPPNTALVEFSLYRTLDRKDGEKTVKGESRYAVYVIRNQGEIRAATLGAATEIDAAIDAYRKSLRDAKSKGFQSAAKNVCEKLIKPIEPFLSDAAHILISPDGELNLIPFEALVDGRNNFLIENYSFTYLTSGRDLLRMQTTERASRGKSLIIANPMFGTAQTEQTIAVNQSKKTATRENKRRSVTGARNMSDMYFAPLGSTTEEARSIQRLFRTRSF